MNGFSAFELMGKPSAEAVEARIQEASAEYRAIKDPIERSNKLELVGTYVSVARHVEEQAQISEGKISLGRASEAIARLKNALGDRDRVVVSKGKVVYQVITPDGNIYDRSDINAIGVERGVSLSKEMVEAIAQNDKRAITKFRKACRDRVEGDKRAHSFEDAVNQISRVILDGMELTFTKGQAELRILGEKSLARDYNARLELIKAGRETAVNESGICFVDGKEVPTFWGVK
jgi:hypothetical protein